MTGNLWEWCLNKYENPEGRNATKIDIPSQRVIRGGSWSNKPGNLRSSNRSRNDADFRDDFIGFRLARDIP
jgi:formylglycine-generating enzyme required for sulfatase activity